mmetsp:Transcript_36988/g.86111  ORF Transcript_36988/g.86111 Transcript_36988/m.86111 type:complete len:176 (-) Transcript_36988:66-593(-)
MHVCVATGIAGVCASLWLPLHTACIGSKAGDVVRVAGLRYVAPYFQEVRLRLRHFQGMRLGEALPEAGRQLRARPEWWAAEIEAGRVLMERASHHSIDLERVAAGYRIRADDRARLRVHVHERVVPDVEPMVVHEDAGVLVVSKPAGIDIFRNPQCGSVKSSLLGEPRERAKGFV